MDHRIQIFGASGSGTTTLAGSLGLALGCPHFDADDYFWKKTLLPYSQERSEEERVRILKTDLASANSWTLSGSVIDWGEQFLSSFTHIVFLYLDTDTRLNRLKLREKAKFFGRIDSGGDMHLQHMKFLNWAAQYDFAGMEMKSRVLHESWLRMAPCPIIRIDGNETTENQVRSVLKLL